MPSNANLLNSGKLVFIILEITLFCIIPLPWFYGFQLPFRNEPA